MDKIAHGTKLMGSRVGGSKLKEDQVLIIYAQKGKRSSYKVGAEFHVHANTIKAIWRKRSWGLAYSEPVRNGANFNAVASAAIFGNFDIR